VKKRKRAVRRSLPLVFRCAGDVVRIRDWPERLIVVTASPRSLEFQ